MQYGRAGGNIDLVREISRVYSPKHSPKGTSPLRIIDPMNEVLVTSGASQAIYLACISYLDIGDEALLISPAFDIYSAAVTLAGAKPIYIPLRPRHGVSDVKTSADLVLDMDEFESLISERTKLFILNSPHNPTGKVFTREEYVQIDAVLNEKAPQCVVVSDEVYEHMVFEGEHIPFTSISESAFERTLSVYSSGKTFSATGLKVGWVIGRENILRELQIAQQYMVFCVNSVSQVAIADSLRAGESPYEGHESYYKWLCATYNRKRDSLVSSLRSTGFNPIVPQGAFYICSQVGEGHAARAVAGLPDAISLLVDENKLQIDLATVNRTDYNISRNLVLKCGVATIPVSAFFAPEDVGKAELSNDYVRFAFCKSDDILEEAKKKLSKTPGTS